ncbi:glycosyltransferase family 4 protein [Leifsonia sp. McL0607]|uniref:glycosyltransferase family 4 protein n=1 Tax=Leifsonia sp. McL0607 TaxID=3415672 RepID=UPI003CEFDAB7
MAGEAPILHHQHVRLYEQVRSAHLERARELAPAAIVYRVKRYDFDPSLTDGVELAQADTLAAARLAMRSRITRVEVDEPLYLDSLPRTAAVLAVLGMKRLGGAPRAEVATYAIEDLDPFAARPARVRSRVRRSIERVLAGYIWHRLDTVVYGTSEADALYNTTFRRAPRRQLTVEALPSPCACASDDASTDGSNEGPVERDSDGVLFLGSFSPRKGFADVLEAWPAIVSRHPGARLTLVGAGELLPEARAAAAADPSIRLIVDPPRSVVHEELRRAHVLVLPSRRVGAWREQVGLPIVEGLAHGCEIVTTSETGIADWLIDAGHVVLPADVLSAGLADGVVDALVNPRSPDEILADLPDVDGRIAAGRALFREAGVHP